MDWVDEREREREREREVLLTIKKCLKAGKHNALSGNTGRERERERGRESGLVVHESKHPGASACDVYADARTRAQGVASRNMPNC